MTKQLETAADVIEALGGPKVVQKLMGNKLSMSTVPMWKFRDRFPPRTYLIFQGALRKRGLSASEKLWGMS